MLNIRNYGDEPVDLSNYYAAFTGNGEDCNVTLQQSLINTSPITISNSSDPVNNTFQDLASGLVLAGDSRIIFGEERGGNFSPNASFIRVISGNFLRSSD